MGRGATSPFFLLVALLLCSGCPSRGTSMELREATKQHSRSSITTAQMDVNAPITTVPIINLTNPTTTTSTPEPTVNPIPSPSAPDPRTVSPLGTNSPSPSSGSWCVASQTASQTALQVALDYACGYGDTDCSGIQPGGRCYEPDTVRDHASYAFNEYYRKNPIPDSCNFGGNAVLTSTDPSSGACQYPSTSTISSVLNTTNANGSTIFGPLPTGPPSSAAAEVCRKLHILILLVLLLNADQF